MGAVVAVLAASRWPDAVTHLVVVATSGGLDTAQLGAQDWRPGYRQLWPKAPEWAFDAPPEMTRVLRSLAMPVLVVTGTNDPISPAPVARQLATLIPSASLCVIDTDNHNFAATSPAPVAAAIRRFVRPGSPGQTCQSGKELGH